MAKKIFGFNEVDRIVGWKTPTFHQASECYVAITAFDPSRGCMRIKKVMLGHIKGKREQKRMGDHLIKKFTEQLMAGWNPWIEAESPTEYTLFNDVCTRYKEYLFKLMKEHNMREESVTSYISRLKIFNDWIKEKDIKLIYAYQFDSRIVGDFLDYIFIERNNTLRTRNNYLAWIKTFAKYLLERNYVSKDPVKCFSNVCVREKKNRDVIPCDILKKIHDYLLIKNKHFLLACQILHYLFVRPREMSYIKVGDISIEHKTLHLHGVNTKNHNDAVLTIPDHVMMLMIDIDLFKYPGNYYLFSDMFAPGRDRRPEKCFRDYWNKIRKDLRLPSVYKFYSLKDTGITNMLKANTDILSVRDQARHSSILVTDIYTPKDIQNANDILVRYKGEL